jgi:protein-tyrosine phosphatase
VSIELHFHLLPSVDDGPEDDAAAVALARAAVADGTGLVVATPHAGFVDVASLAGRVEALRARLRTAGVPLEVRPGAELLAADVLRLDARRLDLVAQGPVGRRWVLLEAPLWGAGLDATPEALDKLRTLDFGILVAHPERSPGWWSDSALERVLEAGARLQVNASSVLGAHGSQAERRALALIRDGRAAALASDAHGPSRPPRLRAAVARLAATGVDAGTLVEEGPAALLEQGLAPLGATHGLAPAP